MPSHDENSKPSLNFSKEILRRWILAAVLLAASSAQAQQTLTGYLKSHPWNAASGPLLVVEPDSVSAKGASPSLNDFDRKKAKIGNLTAIVPAQMVIVDDTFQQPPNLYDGLDPQAKVLYLLSTFNRDQWGAATKDGIGLDGLTNDQAKVFISLLPKTFKWLSVTVDKNGQGDEKDHGTLSEDERAKVRLYVCRQMVFGVHLEGQGSYTQFSQSYLAGEPNTIVLHRDDTDEYGRGEAFGVVAKQTVPNELKKSDLAADAPEMNAPVALPEKATIRQILELVGSATGLEFHADLRVADREVRFWGGRARASEIVKALALAVTGTYRRVGTAYELTSDLVGQGTRKLRYALWGSELHDYEYKKEDEWRGAIDEAGSIKTVGFAANDPAAPTRSLLEKTDPLDTVSPSAAWIPASALTPGMRTILANCAHEYRTEHFDLSNALLHSEYRFGFVLPNGQRLKLEHGQLGSASQFRKRSSSAPRIFQAPVPDKKAQLSEDNPPILAVAPADAQEATKWIQLAGRKGFSEVWVDTVDPKVLQSAIQAATQQRLRVKLTIKPWAAGSPFQSDDPERTILGETPKQLEARKSQSSRWDQLATSGGSVPARELPTLSPGDNALRLYWAMLIELARTPGLAGVALIGTSPSGYEGARTTSSGLLDGNMVETQGFGYSMSQRLAFLRLKSIDPVDIASTQVRCDPDLRQPFFLDDAMRGSRSIYDGTNNPNAAMSTIQKEWDAFRGKSNSEAIVALAKQLAATSLPVLIERRNILINEPYQMRFIAPWAPDEALPQVDLALRTAPQPPVGLLLMDGSTTSPGAINPLRYLGSGFFRKQPLVVNLSALSCQAAAPIMDTCIADKIPPAK